MMTPARFQSVAPRGVSGVIAAVPQKNIVLTVGAKISTLTVRTQIEPLKVGAKIVTLTARPQS